MLEDKDWKCILKSRKQRITNAQVTFNLWIFFTGFI